MYQGYGGGVQYMEVALSPLYWLTSSMKANVWIEEFFYLCLM